MSNSMKVVLICLFFTSLYGLGSNLREDFYVWVCRENAQGELKLIMAGEDLNLTFYRSEVGNRVSFFKKIADEYGHGKGELAVFTDRNSSFLNAVGFKEHLKGFNYVQLVLGVAAERILEEYQLNQAAHNKAVLQRIEERFRKKKKKKR